MRDINFFEDYVDKNQFKIDKKLIFSSLLLLLVLAFFMFSIFNYISIKQDEKVVASLKEIAEDEKTLEKVAEIKEREIEVSEFRESVEKIILLDENLEKTDIISKKLIDDITRKMPDELFITSISMGTSDIQIVGVAEDKWSVAEFEKGLESIDDFDDTFVSNITKEEEYYSFNINILIEDVMFDGEDSGENSEEDSEEETEEVED